MSEPTYAACLTPTGTAAIAVLGIHGVHAWDLARRRFRPRLQTQAIPMAPEKGKVWLGRLGDDISDEVVLSVSRTAPVPEVELHCHGGRAVVRMLLELLHLDGALVCSWEDFIRHTSGNRIRALADISLTKALTTRTAMILLDQCRGAFERDIRAILAALECDAEEAETRLNRLSQSVGLGRHLTSPWRVVVAGPPNVGKSCLVNALSGYQRSVVSPMPGTTRDLVTTIIALDGWPVELVDTAGVRAGGEELEQSGIDLARQAASAADLCLWVLDASTPPVWPNLTLDSLRYVINKMDLPAVWDLDQALDNIRVSASTGQGIADLGQAVSDWLVPSVPPGGTGVPFTAEVCDGVLQARQSFQFNHQSETRRILQRLLGEVS